MAKTKKEQEVIEQVDRFVALVNGGRTMGGVPLLPEIPPQKINHEEIKPSKAEVVDFPEFNEEKAYAEFLKEKEELKKYYKPFLENHAHKPAEVRREMNLVNFDYRKETDEDKKDFNRALKGKGKWEKVTIPHYAGPEGVWNAYYRTTFVLDKKQTGKTYHIDFEAVDYIGDIYLNGKLVTTHTGFFAPFTANITTEVKQGKNTLLIYVKNDIATEGSKTLGPLGHTQYGNKIYAATHLGYDEPEVGWHHCPGGAGVIGKVNFVEANEQRITDIFVRPNIDESVCTVKTVVENYHLGDAVDLKVFYQIEGRNFEGVAVEKFEGKCTDFRWESNFLSETIEIKDFKLWEQDKPYLYQVTVTITDMEGNIIDEKQTHFGMRKFHQDENSTPKGKFYFNNKRIVLRGANEMGHLPRCVMKGDYDQLVEDILIAKICNMNFYRLTQRPVFTVIYDYMDMLGMMCQCDFPLFGNSKPNLLGEMLKQVSEMERHTRNHPSVIIESFCNETIDTVCWHCEQYRIDRYDLEKFFDASRIVCQIENPDRVIKYCDGDYSVVENSYGITEFHTYCLWYTSHTIPYGRLNKGYLPGVRTDWMVGCGEYGCDGLDRYELMKKYYPKKWLPENENDIWCPKTIAMAQCFSGHGNFFPEQYNIHDWIRESREWQRKATKMYVHALRLRTDILESTAIHLLIDAWPAGWTKTLVDVDRIPKPAYYAFKEANIKTRVSTRRDRYVVYAGDKFATEIYAFNDSPDEVKAEIVATVYFNGKVVETYKKSVVAKPTDANYSGEIISSFDNEGKVKVVVKMTTADGVVTFDEAEYIVKQQIKKASKKPLILAESLKDVEKVCEGEVDNNIVFVDSDYYEKNKEELEKKVTEDGIKLYVSLTRPIQVMDYQLQFRIHILADEVSANNQIWRNAENTRTAEFDEFSFANFYNAKKDYVELTDWFKFQWPDAEEMLYVYGGTPKDFFHKGHNLVCASKKFGKGEIILSTLTAVDGCMGYNPVMDKFFVNLIEK